jgi:hypothetical protein
MEAICDQTCDIFQLVFSAQKSVRLLWMPRDFGQAAQSGFVKSYRTPHAELFPTGTRHNAGRPGTDVVIFKIFSPKNSAKKLPFLTENKAN